MVKVVRTERDGTERIMTLEQPVWNKIVKKPHLVPGVKWRLWVAEKPKTTRFVEVPINAEVEIKTPKKPEKVLSEDPVEKKTPEKPVIYGEKEYRADLALAKKLVAEDGGIGAKEAFERALKFKPKNPYIKSQLKKL